MSPWIDYYEELEISRNASDEMIKAAYRAMCKKYHPDTYTGDKTFAESKIKRIYNAYTTLSNEDSKKMYDLEYDLRSRYKQGDIPQTKTTKPAVNKRTKSQVARKIKMPKLLHIILGLGMLCGAIFLGVSLYRYATREKEQLVIVSVPQDYSNYYANNTFDCLADVIQPNSYYYSGDYTIEAIHMPNGKTYEVNHKMNKESNQCYLYLNGIRVKVTVLEKYGDAAKNRANAESLLLRNYSQGFDFCASSNSNMCHVKRCRYARQISTHNIYYFASREAAALMGYDSICDVCAKWKASSETDWSSLPVID